MSVPDGYYALLLLYSNCGGKPGSALTLIAADAVDLHNHQRLRTRQNGIRDLHVDLPHSRQTGRQSGVQYVGIGYKLGADQNTYEWRLNVSVQCSRRSAAIG